MAASLRSLVSQRPAKHAVSFYRCLYSLVFGHVIIHPCVFCNSPVAKMPLPLWQPHQTNPSQPITCTRQTHMPCNVQCTMYNIHCTMNKNTNKMLTPLLADSKLPASPAYLCRAPTQPACPRRTLQQRRRRPRQTGQGALPVAQEEAGRTVRRLT
jgi:hypothetical protein